MRKRQILSASYAALLLLSSQALPASEYTRQKVISGRPNITWTNPLPQAVSPLLAEKILEANSSLNIHKVIVTTPLKRLDLASKMTGKEVFLKDDSLQNSGSFKIRGVACEVYMAMISYIERIAYLLDAGESVPERPFYILTQSDGNHGIAMIAAVAIVVHNQARLRPELAKYIKQIEPIVFTIEALPEAKRTRMFEALRHYREGVGDDKKGDIIVKRDYLEAKDARKAFEAKNSGNVAYMEHGGFNITCGHASVGIEIDQQLRELGIGDDKKVAFLVPVGEGGPTGMLAGLKIKRPGAIGVLVQTNPYSAFVKSLISGKIVSNERDPQPTFIYNGKPRVFEDGIAVDGPDKRAIELAKEIADLGLVVDADANLYYAAPILYKDLSKYPNAVVGGTTSATLEALFEYQDVAPLKDAEVVVLLGCERTVDKEITDYIKDLARDI